MKKVNNYVVYIIMLSICLAAVSCKKNKDTIPPEITVLGPNPAVTGHGVEYIDAGASAYDEEDDNITDKIIVTNEVNTADTGTYYVKYNVQDNAGNMAVEKKRTVRVMYF